ncbi:MAG: glutathione S-transferase N-terminal domain-containing protein [Nitrospirales bacterium]
MKLYHVEWCPDCEVVRRKLEEYEFFYDHEIVEDARPLRTKVHEVSGQYYVPVLVDGETVLTETYDIIAYLDKKSASEKHVDRQQESTPPLSSSDERN